MSIRLDMPREFDLVGSPVMIGGIATGFEATINYRVHDGHDEITGFVTVGGGTGEHGQFQKRIDDPDVIFPGQVLRVPIGDSA